ncbi:hypothetical protein DEU56DRAFT_783251 [Suillus clintonianus]|uniref:uncharacterized protein n=1 Tax=Suillus clintonianus TaxID=1904413 RepID=UPI001B874DEF|nr:uncharacterized protein DEU56DRAFT_783251 [Suillus clintonianus]KAG2147935.1 hypothetical protein DEU56DRAFT_783251 [Suillus clintonianus]
MDLCSDGSVVAGALAHPTFIDESHFEKLDDHCKTSSSLMRRGRPLIPLASRRRAEDILVARKCTYYFQVFSSVKHKFSVRGGPGAKMERWAKEESARGVVGSFDRFTV